MLYSVYVYLLAGGRTVRRRQSSYPKSKERQELTISWNYKKSSRKNIQRDDPNNPLKGKEISNKDIFLIIKSPFLYNRIGTTVLFSEHHWTLWQYRGQIQGRTHS